jgi:hypothetical protein
VWWLDAHRRYFAGQAMREGFEIDDEILTVSERFEIVWPLDVADMVTGRKLTGKLVTPPMVGGDPDFDLSTGQEPEPGIPS